MLKYRRGELAFYKSSLPKELKKYLKEHPETKEYVEMFIEEYEYIYTKKQWVKKG